MATALSHGTFLGAGSLIAARLVRPDKRAGAISMVLTGLTVANIIGVPFGTFIGQQLGWRASFGAIVVIGLISLFGIIRYIPVIHQDKPSSLKQEVRSLFNPKVLLMLLTGAVGCGSLFTVFTYITPLLTDISGFAEHSITDSRPVWYRGNDRQHRWRQACRLETAAIPDRKLCCTGYYFTILTFTLQNKVLAVITVFIWGIAAFGIMPGIQVRIMNLVYEAPLLASTSSHSALNLGNAGGAFIGGVVINQMGLAAIPWVASLITVGGLLLMVVSYIVDRKTAHTEAIAEIQS